ncbi:MAG: HipA domain-containing protein [Ignavibacteriae bacterium]|nr:HipA domain-containing protein [Ignavibacteriota bacterium]
MSRCPITYGEIPDGTRYSSDGLRNLSRQLRNLHDLPYSAEEQRQEAVARASRMSIQGVQPKLSARLNVAREQFDIVDNEGIYILKPQSHYPELPENEDLTMRLAAAIGVEVPLHGLLYSKDTSLTYFIKRFDRGPKKERFAVEDFAQLSMKSRDTKYDSSMEQVASVIDKHCTFPLIEKVKLFRLTLFSFLIGNEDMHLKNFSLIRRERKIELSPAYDLINTTIALGNAAEELALPLDGRKRGLSRSLFVEYFGRKRLSLTESVMSDVLEAFTKGFQIWEDLMTKSFLSENMKGKYSELIRRRRRTLGL